MTPEALAHLPIAMALAAFFGGLMFATLRAWAALTDKIKVAIAEALKAHTDTEDVRWSSIEQRLGRVEAKVDELLMRNQQGE